MPRILTLTLGGKPYSVPVKSMKANREWRKLVAGPLKEVADAILKARALNFGSDLQSALPDLAGLFGSLASLAVESMDLLTDALFEYDPELKRLRDTIEAEATDEEGIAAFVEVIKAVYPLGGLIKVLRGEPTPAQPG